jgi:4-hydroxy-3-methylbut-2-en-1-yl diphosphate reductase
VVFHWAMRTAAAVSIRKGPAATTPRRGRAFSVEDPFRGYDQDMVERVLLASPRGYCAGVERAVETVELALAHYGPPVYVRKQIVHNIHVVRDL